MNLIELKSPSGEDILVNPDAIVAVYPKACPGGIDIDGTKPYVRFVSGKGLDIDDESYQLLRTGMARIVGGKQVERRGH